MEMGTAMATLMNQLMFISFLLSARLCLKSFVLAQQISCLICGG